MALHNYKIATIGLTTLLTAGCSLMSFGRNEPTAYAPPPPLAAAPAGSVTGAPLPPPVGAAQAPTMAPSGGLASLDPSMQPGAIPPGSVAPGATPGAPPPAAGAPGQIGRTDLLGGWTISSAGDSCQLFMTLTTWAGGYRASTRGCATATLQTVSAWNMDGNQVQLLNDAGSTVARLYPNSKTQFSGQTEGGGPVSVSR